jgi:hypothetical protein
MRYYEGTLDRANVFVVERYIDEVW